MDHVRILKKYNTAGMPVCILNVIHNIYFPEKLSQRKCFQLNVYLRCPEQYPKQAGKRLVLLFMWDNPNFIETCTSLRVTNLKLATSLWNFSSFLKHKSGHLSPLPDSSLDLRRENSQEEPQHLALLALESLNEIN